LAFTRCEVARTSIFAKRASTPTFSCGCLPLVL
jgi:hypothetical protein